MSYRILMPFTYKPYADACVASMHSDLIENLIPIDNTKNNLGAAASYNIGAKRILEEKIDWLITLSPSTRFGPKGGLDFIEFIEYIDGWVVEAEMPVGWHFIAWNRKMFERIGIWDENFWPVYGEDADISYRILRAIEDDKIENPWHVFQMDAWLMMQGYSAHLGGIQHSQEKIWEYYKKKWGGLSGHEAYKFPFGDKPLDYWTV